MCWRKCDELRDESKGSIDGRRNCETQLMSKILFVQVQCPLELFVDCRMVVTSMNMRGGVAFLGEWSVLVKNMRENSRPAGAIWMASHAKDKYQTAWEEPQSVRANLNLKSVS